MVAAQTDIVGGRIKAACTRILKVQAAFCAANVVSGSLKPIPRARTPQFPPPSAHSCPPCRAARQAKHPPAPTLRVRQSHSAPYTTPVRHNFLPHRARPPNHAPWLRGCPAPCWRQSPCRCPCLKSKWRGRLSLRHFFTQQQTKARDTTTPRPTNRPSARYAGRAANAL